MLTDYGEEGGLMNGISSPSIPQLAGTTGAGSKGKSSALSDVTNFNPKRRSQGFGVGLGVEGPHQSNEGQIGSGVRRAARRGRANSNASSSLAYAGISGASSPSIQSSVPPGQSHRAVPSLPPVGMPSLHQMKLVQDMPDYRSPTYSLYNMYQDPRRRTQHTQEPRILKEAVLGGNSGTGGGATPWSGQI